MMLIMKRRLLLVATEYPHDCGGRYDWVAFGSVVGVMRWLGCARCMPVARAISRAWPELIGGV